MVMTAKTNTTYTLLLGSCFLFYLISEIFFFSSNASGGESLSLSMSEAVEMGIKQNRKLLEARERLFASEASLESERAKYKPKHFLEAEGARTSQEGSPIQSGESPSSPLITPMTGQAGHTRIDSLVTRYRMKEEMLLPKKIGGRLTFEFNLEGAKREIDAVTEANQYVLGPKTSLTYKQPLTREGRIAESVISTSANSAQEQAKQQYRQIQEQVIFEILTTYHEWLKAKKATEVAREAIQQTEQQVKSTGVQVRLGVLAEIELLKIKVQLAFDENAVIEAEKGEETLHELLRNGLGLARGIQLNPTTLPFFQHVVLDSQKLKEIALIERPEIQILKIQEKISALSIETAKSLDDPFLTAIGAYSRQGSEGNLGDASRNFTQGKQEQWAVSATVTFPLFDGGIAQAATQKALTDGRASSIALDALQEDIAVEVEGAVRAVESSERRFITTESSLKIAEEALRIDQFRFSRGQITATDLLRSQLSLFQLKQGLNNALLDHHIAQIRLYKATGTMREAVENLARR